MQQDLYSYIEHDQPLRLFEVEISRQPQRFKSQGNALLYQALWESKESYFYFIENKLNELNAPVRPIELWSWIHSFLIHLHINNRVIPYGLLAQLFSRRSVGLSASQYSLPIIWPENFRFYRKISESCDAETILFWCNYRPSPMPKRLSLLYNFTLRNDHQALQRFESEGIIQETLSYPKDISEFPFLFFLHEENLNFILRYFPLLDIIDFLKMHTSLFGMASRIMEDIRRRCADLFPLPKDIIYQILDIHPIKRKLEEI